jgi:hypothetical protein
VTDSMDGTGCGASRSPPSAPPSIDAAAAPVTSSQNSTLTFVSTFIAHPPRAVGRPAPRDVRYMERRKSVAGGCGPDESLPGCDRGPRASDGRGQAEEYLGVAVADAGPVGLTDRGISEEPRRHPHVLERVVGREQDVLGAQREERTQQRWAEQTPLVGVALPARHATADVLAAVSTELLATTRAMSAELGHVDPADRSRDVG